MIFNFLRKKYVDYIKWDDYKKKVDFLDYFHFQQSVRKDNIKQISS